MAIKFRLYIVFYTLILAVLLLNRSTDLEVISIAAQVVFGEYMLSTWLRIEWMRIRYERVHDDISNVFQLNPNKEKFEIKIFEGLTKYETTKATSGITLSSKIFDSNNDEVSRDWDRLKLSLGII